MENASCCVRSDLQMAYVDYNLPHIYALVASHDSIRMLVLLVASQYINLEGADASNA